MTALQYVFSSEGEELCSLCAVSFKHYLWAFHAFYVLITLKPLKQTYLYFLFIKHSTVYKIQVVYHDSSVSVTEVPLLTKY